MFMRKYKRRKRKADVDFFQGIHWERSTIILQNLLFHKEFMRKKWQKKIIFMCYGPMITS